MTIAAEDHPVRLVIRSMRQRFIAAARRGEFGRVIDMPPRSLLDEPSYQVRREFLAFCDARPPGPDPAFVRDVSRTTYFRNLRIRKVSVPHPLAKCAKFHDLLSAIRRGHLTDRGHLPVVVLREVGGREVYSRRLDGTHRISICRYMGMEAIPVLAVTEGEYAAFAAREIPRAMVRSELARWPKWYQAIEVLPGLWTRPHRPAKEGAMIAALDKLDLTGRSVLDVGCNTGLYSLEAGMRGAKTVLGVDRRKDTISQAEIVGHLWSVIHPLRGRVKFAVADILDRPELLAGRDTLILACLIYHLGDGLGDFLAAVADSSIHTIVAQGNLARSAKCTPAELAGPAADRPGQAVFDLESFGELLGGIGFRPILRDPGPFPVGIYEKGGRQVKRRDYESYDAYLAQQSAKAQKPSVRRRLADRRAADIARFRGTFALAAEAMPAGGGVLCLGARYGAEVEAAIQLGLRAIGIDLVPSEPLVVSGDFHDIPDSAVRAVAPVGLVFCNSVDHVYDLGRFAAEVRRVLAPAGCFLAVLAIGSFGQYESLRLDTADEFLIEFPGFDLLSQSSNGKAAGSERVTVLLRKQEGRP